MMDSRDTVQSRRTEILKASGLALDQRTVRRRRRAVLSMALVVTCLGTLSVWVFSPALLIAPPVEIAQAPSLVEFAVVHEVQPLALGLIDDAQLEVAFREAGVCAKVFRVENQVRLADCDTGEAVQITRSAS